MKILGDKTWFMVTVWVCVCVSDIISMPPAYVCGRLHCIVYLCVSQCVQRSGRIRACMGMCFHVSLSVCVYTHLLALPQTEFDLSTLSKALNSQKILKILTEINFLISPSMLFWVFCSTLFSLASTRISWPCCTLKLPQWNLSSIMKWVIINECSPILC